MSVWIHFGRLWCWISHSSRWFCIQILSIRSSCSKGLCCWFHRRTPPLCYQKKLFSFWLFLLNCPFSWCSCLWLAASAAISLNDFECRYGSFRNWATSNLTKQFQNCQILYTELIFPQNSFGHRCLQCAQKHHHRLRHHCWPSFFHLNFEFSTHFNCCYTIDFLLQHSLFWCSKTARAIHLLTHSAFAVPDSWGMVLRVSSHRKAVFLIGSWCQKSWILCLFYFLTSNYHLFWRIIFQGEKFYQRFLNLILARYLELIYWTNLFGSSLVGHRIDLYHLFWKNWCF